MSQLYYLSSRANISLWSNPDEISCPANSVDQIFQSFGRMDALDEVHMLPSESPLLRVRGLVKSGGSEMRSLLPLQLVVRGSTSLNIRGIYRRLVKRCLIAMKCSLLHVWRESDGRAEDGSMVMTPCGGTNEMAFSILWEKVSDRIEQLATTMPPEIRTCSSPYATSIPSLDGNKMNSEPPPFLELVDVLAAELLRNSTLTIDISHSQELVDFCRMLSSAYLLPPLTLVRNKIAKTSSPSSWSSGQESGQEMLAKRQCLEWKLQLASTLSLPRWRIPPCDNNPSHCEGVGSGDVQSPARRLHLLFDNACQAKLRYDCQFIFITISVHDLLV